jgi:hypothetical protein
MAIAERLPDGSIEAPMTIGGRDGDGYIGDGVQVLRPGDPDYDAYDRWLKARGE